MKLSDKSKTKPKTNTKFQHRAVDFLILINDKLDEILRKLEELSGGK